MTSPNSSSSISRFARKLRKLNNNPKLFLIDSRGYQIAHRSWKKSLQLGSFLWVVICFSIAVLYFGFIASDRYVSRAELMIKQADQVKMLPDALSMLGIGGSNHQDILLVQDYMKSWDMLYQVGQRTCT